MASTEIVHDVMSTLTFVRGFYWFPAIEGMQGLQLRRHGEIVAGVIYENFNGHNVWMHVAAAPGRHWLTRGYLRAVFEHPFNTLGAKQIFLWANESNAEARRFDEHLGFKLHALIEGAGKDGETAVIYRMKREDCRYV